MSVTHIVVGLVLGVIGSLMILFTASNKSGGQRLPTFPIPGAVLSFLIADSWVPKRGCSVCILAMALALGAGVACKTHEQPGAESGQGAATPQRPLIQPASTSPAPPRNTGDDGGQPSPTQHWMGQARDAGDTERRSEESSGSGDPDQSPQP